MFMSVSLFPAFLPGLALIISLALTQELAKQVSDVDSAIQGALNSVLHLAGQ